MDVSQITPTDISPILETLPAILLEEPGNTSHALSKRVIQVTHDKWANTSALLQAGDWVHSSIVENAKYCLNQYKKIIHVYDSSKIKLKMVATRLLLYINSDPKEKNRLHILEDLYNLYTTNKLPKHIKEPTETLCRFVLKRHEEDTHISTSLILKDEAPWDHPYKKDLNSFRKQFSKVECEEGFTLYHPNASNFAFNYISWYLGKHFDYSEYTESLSDLPKVNPLEMRAVASFYILYLNDMHSELKPYNTIINLLNIIGLKSPSARRILKYYNIKQNLEGSQNSADFNREKFISMMDKILMFFQTVLEQGCSTHVPYALGMFFEEVAQETKSKGITFQKQASQLAKVASSYYDQACQSGHPSIHYIRSLEVIASA